MKPWRRLLAILSLTGLILLLLARARGVGDVPSPPTLEDLDELDLPGYQRLLVLAPHCDDETLGAGGLILNARQRGIQVRVVVATNGDGSLSATMGTGPRPVPGPKDFIHVGTLRQQESLQALRLLGVPEEEVVFLSYPDRGLAALWNDNWSPHSPYRSPYTGACRSPYPRTFRPSVVYAGQDLLADIETIVQSYRPDLVIYPHPHDVHPDHWSLGAFVRLALALAQRHDPTYHPVAYAYLTHRAEFPSPRGLKPEWALLPPPAIFNLGGPWLKVRLSREDDAHKWEACNAYRSQTPFLRDMMESFVRANELLAKVDPVVLPILSAGELLDPGSWRDANGRAVEPVQRDPIRGRVVHKISDAADLVAFYAAERPDGSLAVCARVWGNVERPLTYVLRVMAVGPEGVVHYVTHWGQSSGATHRALAAGHTVCDQVPSSTLKNPWFIYVGAEVRGPEVGVLDRMAWQLIAVEPAPEAAFELEWLPG